MKRTKAFFILCMMFSTLFAQQGILWNKGKLRTVSTEWFDIIYPAESARTAKKIYENADSIYQEVAESYGMEPQARMPVVITPEVESYNAYWSSAYYNHIVIYDTAITDQSLSVFSDDLLSTFKHEVTHAFTYNMKNWIWDLLGHIIGDSFGGGGFSITPGLAEGAAVTCESAQGEGRLNNEFSKHMVRQSKIENQFPDFRDVQGQADRFPTGSFYYFNAAFNQYLQDKYGMEKYAQFWYHLVNGKSLLLEPGFKKVYGMKIQTAYSDFQKEYYVPEVAANPVNAGIVQDFFNSLLKDYSKNNMGGSKYTNLCASSRGLYFIDKKTYALYFVPSENLTADTIKPEVIFSLHNIISASPSSDGRFIAVSWYDLNSATTKIRSGVYAPETNQFFKLPQTGYAYPAIIKNQDSYYLSSLKFFSQNKQIEVYKLNITDNRIKSADLFSTTVLDEYRSAANFTDVSNGSFAYISKNKLNFSICISDLYGNVTKEYSLPVSKTAIQGLTYNPSSNELSFSYTQKDFLPMLGKLNLTTGTFSSWKENISGGIFEPVLFNSKLYYISHFYTQNRLLSKPENQIKYEKQQAVVQIRQGGVEHAPGDVQNLPGAPQDTLPYANFHGFKYLCKGLFIPLSMLTSVSYNPDSTGAYYLPLGFTYTTNNPWDGNKYTLSAGYGPQTNSFAAQLDFSSGTDTSLFTYGLSAGAEFDHKGFKQTNNKLSLISGFKPGRNSTLALSNTSVFHYGRSNKNSLTYTMDFASFFGGAASDDDTNYIYGINQTKVTYAYSIYTGPGLYEKLGMNISGLLYWDYNSSTGQNREVYKNGVDAGFGFNFYVPKLIPVQNKQGIVTNLPTRFSANLFSTPVSEETISLAGYNFGSKQDFPIFTMASAGFETILFQKDIQKTMVFMPLLFANDIRISFSYYAGIYTNSECYGDTWKITHMGKYIGMLKEGKLDVINFPYLKLSMGITPAFGGTASTSYKQLLCLRAGLIIQDQRVVPLWNLAFDVAF